MSAMKTAKPRMESPVRGMAVALGALNLYKIIMLSPTNPKKYCEYYVLNSLIIYNI